MDAPANPIPFRIKAEGASGSIELDGRDVTAAVAGVVFTAGVGDVARLTIEAVPGRATELDGLAIVQLAGSAVTGDDVRNLDPALIRACYDRLAEDLGGDLLEMAIEAVARAFDVQAES